MLKKILFLKINYIRKKNRVPKNILTAFSWPCSTSTLPYQISNFYCLRPTFLALKQALCTQTNRRKYIVGAYRFHGTATGPQLCTMMCLHHIHKLWNVKEGISILMAPMYVICTRNVLHAMPEYDFIRFICKILAKQGKLFTVACKHLMLKNICSLQ